MTENVLLALIPAVLTVLLAAIQLIDGRRDRRAMLTRIQRVSRRMYTA